MPSPTVVEELEAIMRMLFADLMCGFADTKVCSIFYHNKLRIQITVYYFVLYSILFIFTVRIIALRAVHRVPVIAFDTTQNKAKQFSEVSDNKLFFL